MINYVSGIVFVVGLVITGVLRAAARGATRFGGPHRPCGPGHRQRRRLLHPDRGAVGAWRGLPAGAVSRRPRAGDLPHHSNGCERVYGQRSWILSIPFQMNHLRNPLRRVFHFVT